jgi:Tol biopolymer transport system component
VACAFPAAAVAAPNDTTLISRADTASGIKQDGTFVDAPAISADGRFVAFTTNAGNLDGAPGGSQVYLRDTQLNDVALVSVDLMTGNPNGDANNASVSENGRYVAFESDASNLGTDDMDVATDVFVRDMQTGTVTLVSRATTAGGATSDGVSTKPSISADGTRVAFQSTATNLGTDADVKSDIFVRDTQAATTTLVSRAANPGNGASQNAAISGDGRHVAFDSKSTNLPDDGDANDDVFVRDTQANTTTLVDRADGVNGAKGTNSLDPAISSDGRFVAFSSMAAIESPADSNGVGDVYVRDVQTADTALVSRQDGAAGAVGGGTSPISAFASISANGRFVGFQSTATNFGDDAAAVDPLSRDVWLRDTQANDTILLSRESASIGGAPGNGDSNRPAISGDGRITAFYTEASNLDGGIADTSGDTDVYTREADVDIVAPTAQITSAPPARTADNTPTVGYSSPAGDLAGFECSIDGAAFAACAGTSITTPQLADGAHNVRVRAFDTAANRGSPVTANFTVDTTGPATQIDSAPPATSTNNTASVAFSSPDADTASFRCALDDAAFAACSSPFTTPALAIGAHTVDVGAVDDVGNLGAPQRVSFTVRAPDTDPTPVPDTKAPETQLLGKASIKTTKTKVSISFQADEAATFECRVDGKPFAPCTSPFTTPKLKPGKHTVDVRATDQAGNVDQTPAQAKVKVKRKKRRR